VANGLFPSSCSQNCVESLWKSIFLKEHERNKLTLTQSWVWSPIKSPHPSLVCCVPQTHFRTQLSWGNSGYKISCCCQARNQRGGQSGNFPPKFSQTYVFVKCCNKLNHFPPKISVGCGLGCCVRIFDWSHWLTLLELDHKPGVGSLNTRHSTKVFSFPNWLT